MLIADDDARQRALVRMRLRRLGMTVIAEAADGASAVTAAREYQPGLVLLDVAMPVMGGLEALPRIREAAPDAKVMMLSAFGRARTEEEAIKAGADAYLEKSATLSELSQAMQHLLGGAPPADLATPADLHAGPAGQAPGITQTQLQRLAGVFSFTIRPDRSAAVSAECGSAFREVPAESESTEDLVARTHPEDAAGTRQLSRDVFVTDEPLTPQRRVVGADGGHLVLHTSVQRVVDEHGAVSAIGACLDITHPERTADALLEVEERYQALARSGTHILSLLDIDGRYLYVAPSVVGRGYSPEDLVGRTVSEFVPEQDVETITRAFYEVATDPKYRAGATLQLTLRYLLPDGQLSWFETSLQARGDSEGNFQEIVSYSRDVTAQVTQQQTQLTRLAELEGKVAQLESTNADLAAFATTVAHDLAAPLAAISGFSELLSETATNKLDDEERERLGHIDGEARRAQALIRSVLRLSRTGVAADMGPVDLAEVVLHVCDTLAPQLVDVDLRIGQLPIVHGERSALGQVLQNLLANAAKFVAPETHPVVVVSSRRQSSGWLLSVEDNGVGIDAADRELIFAMFGRAHEQFEGTGVGLAICRRVVAQHGGRLWVEARPEGGSRFCVLLPDEAASAPMPERDEPGASMVRHDAVTAATSDDAT